MASDKTQRRHLGRERRRGYRHTHRPGELRARVLAALPSTSADAITARMVALRAHLEIDVVRVRLLQLCKEGWVARRVDQPAVRGFVYWRDEVPA